MVAAVPPADPAAAPPALRPAAPAAPQAQGGRFEDNAPRPAPRPGDREIVSPITAVQPGARGDHLHGLLGLSPGGEPKFKPTPLPQLSASEKRLAHMGQCYNARMSDSL